LNLLRLYDEFDEIYDRVMTPPKTVLYLIVVGGEQPSRECLVGLCHQG